MNDMDKRVADDPTLTDAQKLQHAFGNKFQPLASIIEIAIKLLRRWGYEMLATQLEIALNTYLDEMREMIERMGEAKDKRIKDLQARLDAAELWCKEDAIQLGTGMYFVKPEDILKILTDDEPQGKEHTE